jgi:hypothetical protein
MRRREFITLVGSAAVTPLAAHAQQSAMPVIGFLGTRAPGDDPQLLTEFRQGLKDAGYIEGQNVAMEYRFAENQYDRLPSLAADLVRRQVAVIVANGRAAQAAKEATTTIPIAFVAGFDPVEVGLVAHESARRQYYRRQHLGCGARAEAAADAARVGPYCDHHCRARQPNRSRACRDHIEGIAGGSRYPRAAASCPAC